MLGCHAFALEETGDYAAAERAGRDAIALNPADIWAAHAVAHVMEMTGRPREGAAWIGGLEGDWRETNNFVYHPLWHRCLFLLELGEHGRVLELYDREVRPESTDDLLDISNAVALLWRLEQAGVDVGRRWEELAARSLGHIDDHLLVFGDIHYLMALAAAGQAPDVARMEESLGRYAAESGESEAAVMREAGLALAAAVLAHRRGEHARAVDALLPARAAIRRIGGSHAQRDLFEQLLIDAALRAGRHEVARDLLGERLAQRPRNIWGWQHLGAALAAAGDAQGAADARARAAELRATA